MPWRSLRSPPAPKTRRRCRSERCSADHPARRRDRTPSRISCEVLRGDRVEHLRAVEAHDHKCGSGASTFNVLRFSGIFIPPPARACASKQRQLPRRARAGAAEGRTLAVEGERHPHQRDAAVRRLLQHAERLTLRMRQHFVEAQHRGARHSGCIKYALPVLAASALHNVGDQRVDALTMADTIGIGAKLRVACPFRMAERGREPRELLIVAGANYRPAVACLEGFVGGEIAILRAHATRHLLDAR